VIKAVVRDSLKLNQYTSLTYSVFPVQFRINIVIELLVGTIVVLRETEFTCCNAFPRAGIWHGADQLFSLPTVAVFLWE